MRQQRRSRRRSEPDESTAPPAVPPWFWETDDMQAALRSRHMGKVIRAYRQHPHHGYGGLSQEVVAVWAQMSQGQISRVESGRPPDNLGRLIYWARLLGIPQRYLWFALPRATSDEESSEASTGEPSIDPTVDELGQYAGLETPADAVPSDTPSGSPHRLEPTMAPQADPGGMPLTDEEQTTAPTLPRPPINIDLHTAQPARITDYVRGGGANFDIDRKAVDQMVQPLPGGIDCAKASAAASQWFQKRIVHYLLNEVCLKQILYISPAVPTDSTIQYAIHETAPNVRAVFVIDDDTVLAHAHRLARGRYEEGVATFIRGSADDADVFLARAARVLDFRSPLGVVVNASFHTVVDESVARRSVARISDALPSGSYVSIVNIASDLLGDAIAQVIQLMDELVKESKATPMAFRSREQMTRLFDGLELVEPGIVPLDQWRPDETTPMTKTPKVFVYGGVGRKP